MYTHNAYLKAVWHSCSVGSENHVTQLFFTHPVLVCRLLMMSYLLSCCFLLVDRYHRILPLVRKHETERFSHVGTCFEVRTYTLIRITISNFNTRTDSLLLSESDFVHIHNTLVKMTSAWGQRSLNRSRQMTVIRTYSN